MMIFTITVRWVFPLSLSWLPCLDDSRHAPTGTAGASAYIDRLIFGDNHVQQPFLVHCMEDPSIRCPSPIDDLGILGTLAACVTTMLGVQAAVTLKRITSFQEHETNNLESRTNKIWSLFLRWGILALVFGIMASVMNGFHNWFDFSDNKSVRFAWIPIVKIIWSPSFVCAMACINFLQCIVLYSIIDLPSYLYVIFEREAREFESHPSKYLRTLTNPSTL